MNKEEVAQAPSNLVFGYLNLFSDGVVCVPAISLILSFLFSFDLSCHCSFPKNLELLKYCLNFFLKKKKQINKTKPRGECALIFYGLHVTLQHNFTDGMALGSAFLLYGSIGGWSRTLFLLAHELPQEVCFLPYLINIVFEGSFLDNLIYDVGLTFRHIFVFYLFILSSSFWQI